MAHYKQNDDKSSNLNYKKLQAYGIYSWCNCFAKRYCNKIIKVSK